MLFFEILWWMQALRHDYFSYFPSRYLLSITMIFGATVAGMTSEGGGAVAFPVMTLALGIAPSVARDFSLMIQSCGMTAAAFTIFWMRIKLEKHSLIFCSTGAFAGMILGKRCGSVSDCSTLIGRELQSVEIFLWRCYTSSLSLVASCTERLPYAKKNKMPCYWGILHAMSWLFIA